MNDDQEPEQLDFLDELLAMGEQEPEEYIHWEQPFDPISTLAGLLPKKSYTNTPIKGLAAAISTTPFPHDGQTIAQLSLDETIMIAAATDFVQDYNIQTESTTDAKTYLREAATAFGNKLITIIKTKEQFGPLKTPAIEEPTREDTQDRQGPLSQANNPELFLIAKKTYALLEENDQLIKNLQESDDLKTALNLRTIATIAPNDYAKQARTALRKGTIDQGLAKEAFFSLAKHLTPALKEQELGTLMALHDNYKRSFFKHVEELKPLIENYRPQDLNYQALITEITNRFLEEKGLVFVHHKPIADAHRFAQFKDQIRHHTGIKAFKPAETDEPTAPHDFVRIYRALQGNTYKRGTSIENIPIGTIGRIDSSRDFIDQITGRDRGKAISRDEMQKLEPYEGLHLGGEGKKAIIIKDNGYTITKNGSWGQILEDNGNTYRIRFDYLATDHEVPYVFDDIYKEDVRVEENDPEKFKESRIFFNHLENLIETVEKEYRSKGDHVRERIAEAVDFFKDLGMQDDVINYFFEMNMQRHEAIERENLIPKTSLLTAMEDFMPLWEYEETAQKIIDNLRDDHKLHSPLQADDAYDLDEYQQFKTMLLEMDDHVFIMGEQKPKEDLELLDRVVVMEKDEIVATGIYVRVDEDDDYQLLAGEDLDTHYFSIFNHELKPLITLSQTPKLFENGLYFGASVKTAKGIEAKIYDYQYGTAYLATADGQFITENETNIQLLKPLTAEERQAIQKQQEAAANQYKPQIQAAITKAEEQYAKQSATFMEELDKRRGFLNQLGFTDEDIYDYLTDQIDDYDQIKEMGTTDTKK